MRLEDLTEEQRAELKREIARESSYYCGIDPGLTGFLAVINDQDDVRFLQAPLLGGESESGKSANKGSRRVYDVPGVLSLLSELDGVKLCYLEKLQCMPKNGGLANFRAGFADAMWRTALTAQAIPFTLVRPAGWKKTMGVTGIGKDAAARRNDSKRKAIEKAQQLFPGVNLLATERSRKPSSDKAESLLLAYLARQEVRGA